MNIYTDLWFELSVSYFVIVLTHCKLLNWHTSAMRSHTKMVGPTGQEVDRKNGWTVSPKMYVMDIHCVSKNIPDDFSYNSKKALTDFYNIWQKCY